MFEISEFCQRRPDISRKRRHSDYEDDNNNAVKRRRFYADNFSVEPREQILSALNDLNLCRDLSTSWNWLVCRMLPLNMIYVVQEEVNCMLTAIRRDSHFHAEDLDDFHKHFMNLKRSLMEVDYLGIDDYSFLSPFLEVIRSDETTGKVTSLALSSINKYILYGLINPSGKSVTSTVEYISHAITHARFVGTDHPVDGNVLMNILKVLRNLILSPEGEKLTDESICEIMRRCFSIHLQSSHNELVRKFAEQSLKDMIQLLFSRLPEFSGCYENCQLPVKNCNIHASNVEPSRGKLKKHCFSQKSKPSRSVPKLDPSKAKGLLPQHAESTMPGSEFVSPMEKSSMMPTAPLAITPITSAGNIVDLQGAIRQESSPPPPPLSEEDTTSSSIDATSISDQDQHEDLHQPVSLDEPIQELPFSPDLGNPTVFSCAVINVEPESLSGYESPSLSSRTCSVEDISLSSPQVEMPAIIQSDDVRDNVEKVVESVVEEDSAIQEYVNSRGVRFMSYEYVQYDESSLIPYGPLCIRELFRILLSLCNPMDKQNNEIRIQLGLKLLTVSLEIGADSIGKCNYMLALVKDELCRSLFMLLNSERLSIFAANLQVLFLLFESLRTHLKFQLETYLTKLINVIESNSNMITFKQKVIVLESVNKLWRIPGLVTELFLNYDCDLYCPNLFEDLTKLLSKNAFPVSGLYNTHLLSLDALLTIIDTIEAHCNSRILNERKEESSLGDGLPVSSRRWSARQLVSENIPSHEQLMAIKRKKKLLTIGTELFNANHKKGIHFLQEHHLLSVSLDPLEVVHFLRENPQLDKKMIGEYISNRANLQVLDSFVKSFDFSDTRIDEALRLFLEAFRLPGESPLISLIMEHFAEHWHKCNREPFANADAAFTLAYAVIMLNVDQHNYNVKRRNNPMTVDEFKRNLRNVDDQNFEQEMLDNIYNAIKSEEIVLPAENKGLMRDNYLWKVLLQRGSSKDGVFIHSQNDMYDHDLFSLIWGPTVAALSYVFDKSNDNMIYQKAISGFRKVAMISAHYGMSNSFDNLVISLCKFTTLLNSSENADGLTVAFGANPKAQIATKTVFHLAFRYGDILQEGWKNVLDCVLQLYRCKLLPKALVEAEDFLDTSGKISLVREETPSQKIETRLFISLFSYIALASGSKKQRVQSAEDQEHIRKAHRCVCDCHLEEFITQSKFLRLDSLQELVKALIVASHGPGIGATYDEDLPVFFLELFLKVVIQNRDRVNTIWQSVHDHIYSLMMGTSTCDHYFLIERSVVGLLRLAICLVQREDMSSVVLQSLRMLLILKSATLFRVSCQVAYGLHELLKTSTANIHSDTDWSIIFTLLECVGAGAPPPSVVGDSSKAPTDQNAKSDSELVHDDDSGLGNERGYTSDSELTRAPDRQQHVSLITRPTSSELSPNTGGGWIPVGCEGEIQPLQMRSLPINQFSIVHERELLVHDPFGLVKCCESLAFLVRDVAHITPYNFENCIHCIRTFVEASLNGTSHHGSKKIASSSKDVKTTKNSIIRQRVTNYKQRSPQNAYDADESDSEELPSGYHHVSIQLLELMHTLHTRTAQIFRCWAEENGDTDCSSLWAQGWCPLLQGIARLCCDSRKQVRMSAITYLQRALWLQDLQALTAPQWESCFNKVLFPLLAKLLEPVSPQDPMGMEETRMSAATVLLKVFLHHLTPLQSLPTFTAVWLTILDFMDKYMHADKSDLLYEAIPMSLKNMLMKMDSARVFSTPDGYSPLWTITWDRINQFVPRLGEELFKSHPAVEMQNKQESRDIGSLSPPPLEVVQVPAAVVATVPGPSVATPPTEPAASSIILQPTLPAPTYNVTSIFTHMGQPTQNPHTPYTSRQM